jgi:uncharacterized short protein YbdD (DUF466 family)
MSDLPAVTPSPTGPRLRLFLTTLRQIVGMPDYDAYLAHVRARHPDRAIPTERQYFEEYLTARYENGPTRCC